jgi:hypothetical protein
MNMEPQTLAFLSVPVDLDDGPILSMSPKQSHVFAKIIHPSTWLPIIVHYPLAQYSSKIRKSQGSSEVHTLIVFLDWAVAI